MTTPDFFRARLDAMIDLRHPLAVLATRMPWAEIESALAMIAVLAGPLAELKQVISSYVKPGGKLALSGILESKAQSVIDAYSDEFSFDPIAMQEEWVRLSAQKRL